MITKKHQETYRRIVLAAIFRIKKRKKTII